GSAVKFARAVLDGERPNIPEVAVDVLANLSNQMVALHLRILWYDKRLQLEARQDPRVMLLRTIPGVGPITASAIVATAGDGHQFRNGREFAAWLGLTPLNRSSGGKEKLGRISKMGDRYVRRLLVAGMTARLRQMKINPERVDPWAIALLERKSPRLATVAMANKTARIVWAVLTRNEYYRPRVA
ncbi:IS110 family RNA-guided transposase, partial [Roseovarius aestuarii]